MQKVFAEHASEFASPEWGNEPGTIRDRDLPSEFRFWSGEEKLGNERAVGCNQRRPSSRAESISSTVV